MSSGMCFVDCAINHQFSMNGHRCLLGWGGVNLKFYGSATPPASQLIPLILRSKNNTIIIYIIMHSTAHDAHRLDAGYSNRVESR